jgi:PEGA domain
MRRLAFVVLIAVMSTWSAGCATLFAGGAETVSIDSEPDGARVTTQNGQTLGSTPFTTQLDPSKTYVLTFARDGYDNATFTLGKKVDSIAFLNLLCVLCWGIDFATGAIWGLDTHEVNVTLNRRSAAMEKLTPEQRGAVTFGVPLETFVQDGMHH